MIKQWVWLLLAQMVVAQCEFGCQKCEEKSCVACEPNLYLYPDGEKNICIPDCNLVDRNMVNDQVERQCIYLGPFCEQVSMVQSSITGKYEPICQFSHMSNHGYVIGSRYRILNYINSVTAINSNTSNYGSLNDLKSAGLYYINSAEETSLSDIKKEMNVKVTAKCANKYCNNCNDYNLAQCTTCQGRFGNSAKWNTCYERRTCESLRENQRFKTGCYRTSSDCLTCELCDIGFSLQTSNGICKDCKELDENCYECSGQDNLKCDHCLDGYGVNTATGKCLQCDGNNIKQCQFDENLYQTIMMCSDNYVLSSDGKSCTKKCEKNEFLEIGHQGDVEYNFVNKAKCKACDSSCGSCIGPEASQCITCNDGKYLTDIDGGGSCAEKSVSTDAENLQILVQNQIVAGQANQKIKSNLLEAIFYAYQQATKLQGQTIEILMETGSHFITSTMVNEMVSNKTINFDVDFINPLFDLSIKPLKCEGSQFDSIKCQKSNETVTIVNKVGSFFKIQVPKSLKVEGIIFEGIDSLQKIENSRSDTLTRDCFWQGKSSEPVCPDGDLNDIDRDQICQFRSYNSLFQLRTIDKPTLQKLEIVNCTFQNFLYEIGSLVRLPQRPDQDKNGVILPWNLTIIDSTFRNMSFCGSIVSNDFPTFEGDILFNDGIKSQIQSYYGSQAGQQSICQADCFTFIFKNNQIQNLNQMKKSNQQNYFAQKVNWQMQKLGLAIHLKNFVGNFSIHNNTFADTQMNFTPSCNDWTDIDSFYTAAQSPRFSSLIPRQNDAFQLHSLIVIDNLQGSFTLSSNMFRDNFLTNNLISISSQSSSVSIKDNLFFSSSSFLGTNILTVTILTPSWTSSCGRNTLISSNLFRDIQSNCLVDTGLIRVQCNNTLYAEEVRVDEQRRDYTYINQTRQIAPSRGVVEMTQKGEGVKIQGNQVVACQVGRRQNTRRGLEVVEQGYTGSLFSLQDVSGLNFTGNSMTNISSNNSSSLILSQNLNSISLENLTLTNISAENLISSLNKMSNMSLIKMDARDFKGIRKIMEVNTNELVMENVTIQNMQVGDNVNAFIFDNYKQAINGVSLKNLTLKNVYGNNLTSIFDLKAANFSINSSTFENITDTILKLQPSKNLTIENCTFNKTGNILSINNENSNLSSILTNNFFDTNGYLISFNNTGVKISDFNITLQNSQIISQTQMFKFDAPISNLTLKANVYSNVNEKFDAQKGPKNVQIQDSQISNFTTVNLFEVQNYSEGYVLFKNLTVSNIKGSLIVANNSNVKFEQVTANNIYADQAMSFKNGLKTSITQSSFKNCNSQLINHEGQTLNISDTSFTDNTGSSLLQCNNSSIILSSLSVLRNSFNFSSSFVSSDLSLKNSTFSQNTALNGSATLSLLDSTSLLDTCTFSDNLASNLTHVLLSNKALEIQRSSFFSSKYYSVPGVNGSYINFEGSLLVNQTNFRMAQAEFGGAIYSKRVERMVVANSSFQYNKAVVSGGAIYVDEMSEYEVRVEKTKFNDNLAGLYGDNVYARQTKRNVAGRRLQEQTRAVVIEGSTFQTPQAQNQIFIEAVEKVQLENSVFLKMENSQTFEGGSIYCLNCLEVLIKNSTFDQQIALVRGGAIYLAQTQDNYFGQSFDKTHVLDSNTFTQCQSQQGGSIYLKNVQNTQLIGQNIFTESKVIYFNETQPFYSSSVEFGGVTIDKSFQDLSSETTIGKGPVLFFDCPESQSCLLDISDTTTITSPQILIGYRNKQYPTDAVISGMFYTDVKPIVPASLANQVIQEFSVKIEGASLALVTGAEEETVKGLVTKVQTSFELDPKLKYKVENTEKWDEQTAKLYKIDQFQSKVSYIFGEQPVVVVNTENEVQFYDSKSQLSIEITGTYDNVIETRLIEEDHLLLDVIKQTKLTYQAKNGVFTIPKIYLQAMPGIKVNLTISANFFKSDISIQKTLQLDMQLCNLGEILNSKGVCQLCLGPDLYILEAASVTTIQECLQCQKDVFRCRGGNIIEAKLGYQRLVNDTFIKCNDIGGVDQCLANNTCELGYEGFMCKQCQPNYYKDFDGQCTKCKRSYTGAIFVWIEIIGLVLLLTLVVFNSQQKNNISQSFNLFKNMANYIIYMSILSEIFEKTWMNNRTYFKPAILKPLRYFYQFPYTTFHVSQCSEAGEEDEPLFTQPLNQTLATELNDNAQAIKRNIFILFLLMNLSFFVGAILILIYNSINQNKPPEEVLKVQPSEEKQKQNPFFVDSVSVEKEKLLTVNQNLLSLDKSNIQSSFDASPRPDKKKKKNKKKNKSSKSQSSSKRSQNSKRSKISKMSKRSQNDSDFEGGTEEDKDDPDNQQNFVQILNLKHSPDQSNENSLDTIPKPLISKESITKQLQLYKFSRTTIFLSILALLVSTQMMEQQFVFFACNVAFEDTQVNYYDSSIQCSDSYVSWTFVLFCVIWLFSQPIYVMVKGGAEYIIEYTGIVIKLCLLLIAKNVLVMNEVSQAGMAVFFVTIQMMVFLILKQKRVQGQSEKMLKLYQINFIDTLMYSCVILSAFIGLILASTVDESNYSAGWDIFLVFVHMSFLVCLGVFIIRHFLKFLRSNPRLVYVYMVVTCFLSKQTVEQNRREMEDIQRKEKKVEEQMKKIDNMIQHLQNVQQEIQDKPERLEDNREKIRSQERLMRELQVLIAEKEQMKYSTPSYEKNHKPKDEIFMKEISKLQSEIDEYKDSMLDISKPEPISNISGSQKSLSPVSNQRSLNLANDFGANIVCSNSTLGNNNDNNEERPEQIDQEMIPPQSADKLMITINQSQPTIDEPQQRVLLKRHQTSYMEEEEKTPHRNPKDPNIANSDGNNDDLHHEQVSFTTSLLRSNTNTIQPASQLIQFAENEISKLSLIQSSLTHKNLRENDIELSASKRAETILVNKFNVDLEGNHVRKDDSLEFENEEEEDLTKRENFEEKDDENFTRRESNVTKKEEYEEEDESEPFELSNILSNINNSKGKIKPVLRLKDISGIEKHYQEWKENSMRSLGEAPINQIGAIGTIWKESQDNTISGGEMITVNNQESFNQPTIRNLNPSSSMFEIKKESNLIKQKQYSNYVREMSKEKLGKQTDRKKEESDDYIPSLYEKSKLYSKQLRDQNRLLTKGSDVNKSVESLEAKVVINGQFVSYNDSFQYSQRNLHIQREEVRKQRSVLPKNFGNVPVPPIKGLVSQSVSTSKLMQNNEQWVKESPYNSTKNSGQMDSQPQINQLGLTFNQQQVVQDLLSKGKSLLGRYRPQPGERALSSGKSRQSEFPPLGPKIEQNIQLRQELSNIQRKSKSQQRSRPFKLEKYQVLGYDLKKKRLQIQELQNKLKEIEK